MSGVTLSQGGARGGGSPGLHGAAGGGRSGRPRAEPSVSEGTLDDVGAAGPYCVRDSEEAQPSSAGRPSASGVRRKPDPWEGSHPKGGTPGTVPRKGNPLPWPGEAWGSGEKDELLKVLTSDGAENRLIGGAADRVTQTLALARGNGQTVVVPFSFFEPTGTGTVPDFDALAFTDYGHTVCLGDYEASTDAILYEADPGYRQQIDKARAKSE